MNELFIDGDSTILDLLRSAYSAGWCAGYKEKGVEFDWIDEGFQEYVKEHLQKKGG